MFYVEPCDRGKGNSVLHIKAGVTSIQCISSGSILWRRFIVGYGLQTLSYVLRVVGGEMFLKLVPVLGLTGPDGLSPVYLTFLQLSLSLSSYASCFACSLCLM